MQCLVIGTQPFCTAGLVHAASALDTWLIVPPSMTTLNFSFILQGGRNEVSSLASHESNAEWTKFERALLRWASRGDLDIAFSAWSLSKTAPIGGQYSRVARDDLEKMLRTRMPMVNARAVGS